VVEGALPICVNYSRQVSGRLERQARHHFAVALVAVDDFGGDGAIRKAYGNGTGIPTDNQLVLIFFVSSLHGQHTRTWEQD
jgi:hypothetical protein